MLCMCNQIVWLAIQPRVSQLDVSTDSITYGAGDTITVLGTIKLDMDVSGVTVLVQTHKVNDDSVVETLLNTTTNFLTGTAKTLAAIKGSALTTTINILTNYYVKLTISGGIPALTGLGDLTNQYGFVVQDIIAPQIPIELALSQFNAGYSIIMTKD